MCGRYYVSDSPDVHALMAILDLPLFPESRRNVAPGAKGQFVVERRLTARGVCSLFAAWISFAA